MSECIKPEGNTVFTQFEDLDDKARFIDIVKVHFSNSWPDAYKNSGTQITLKDDFIGLAHETYQLSLSQYTVALKSQNPDHYKRAGALLHALYVTKPIGKVEFTEASQYYRDFENVGVSYADSEHWENYCSWFENYANFALAFDLAFRCCSVYEAEYKEFNSDFLDNMCYYMSENTAISVPSFMMIFKAFMT